MLLLAWHEVVHSGMSVNYSDLNAPTLTCISEPTGRVSERACMRFPPLDPHRILTVHDLLNQVGHRTGSLVRYPRWRAA
jgi:hypothetical protein